ncbi:Pimeloyl-ACP methyl ester carboxylesterase [Terribacillus aidingensis]|uniref:Pimeloyl-ACP methyl ester carboxylesterase n=1 Tax=Terribacillus aidingensis TaxID=586416 RepID=A0A285N6B5_9BACI|nr:alpha/beta hydrolase [Terribacillus aidingensis]SNZ04959.1 Pimeloyl-ACP methyl ester carboxylesterase [Terribacillus aidingensis]
MKITIYHPQQESTLLFLHGGGVGGWMWTQQIECFSDYRCAVAELDFRKEGASIEQIATDLLTWAESNKGAGKLALIGFSIGAQIALQMISKRPDLFSFTMLNSPLTVASNIPLFMIEAVVRLTHPLIKNRSFAALQARVLCIPAEDFDTYYQYSQRITPRELVQTLTENMQFRIPDSFHSISANILVTVGAKENQIMKKSAQLLTLTNPNCISMLVADTGHGLPLTHPLLFNSLLRQKLIAYLS